LTKDELIALAKSIATQFGIDPILVCAVVEQESGWNTWAIRAEPAFDAKYVQPLHKTPTEEWARSISWGLMQLMGQSACEHGYTGDIPQLCDPTFGLVWGCTHLKVKLAAFGGDFTKALLAWNGGGNSNYPAEVLARIKNYS